MMKMTLVELAEKYANNIRFVYESDVMQKVAKMYAKQAYIAGAKDINVPSKWHFVKDELPKEEGEYLVCYQTIAGGRNVLLLKYEERDGDLHWIDGEYKLDKGVIAWQPLPSIPKER